VRAVLARDESWAPAGHEVAWGQAQLAARPWTEPVAAGGGSGVLGDRLDQVRGVLTGLAGRALSGPRLDAWRAPTDNDRIPQASAAEAWQRIGLHRLQHRLLDVHEEGDAVVVHTRTAPAALDIGLLTTMRWTPCAEPDALPLDVSVHPEGDWPGSLPRLGARVVAAGRARHRHVVRRRSRRVLPRHRPSRPDRPVHQLRGRPADAIRHGPRRTAGAATCAGSSSPTGGAGACAWQRSRPAARAHRRSDSPPGADLDAARHPVDLAAGDRLWLTIDLAHRGVGTASCGPDVLPQYELPAAPATLRLVLTAA
jgi:beta-galactosidase